MDEYSVLNKYSKIIFSSPYKKLALAAASKYLADAKRSGEHRISVTIHRDKYF